MGLMGLMRLMGFGRWAHESHESHRSHSCFPGGVDLPYAPVPTTIRSTDQRYVHWVRSFRTLLRKYVFNLAHNDRGVVCPHILADLIRIWMI